MVIRLLVTALVGLAVFVLVGCGDRYAGTWESAQCDEYLPDGTVKGPATITIEKHGDGYIVRGFPSTESSYPVKAVEVSGGATCAEVPKVLASVLSGNPLPGWKGVPAHFELPEKLRTMRMARASDGDPTGHTVAVTPVQTAGENHIARHGLPFRTSQAPQPARHQLPAATSQR